MTSTEANHNVRVGPIFGVVITGAFIAFLNQTLINVALPQIMDSLHITATTGDWMTTIFMLVNGVVIPITAFLMERFSTRQLYITSMTLFASGTLICGIGPDFGIILVGRVVQAIGAGILMPMVTTVIFTLFPPEKRGMAMGIYGIALNFAPAVGPTLSGWIVQTYSWRILFFIVLPIAIVDIIIAIFLLKNVTETKKSKLDVLGVILSTVGFGGVLYGFSVAGSNGWGSSDVISTFVIGGVSLALFIWRQLAVRHAILEFRIFRYPMFTLTTMINVIVTMALYAGMILTPIFIQNILQVSPLMSGLMYLPGGILMGIMSPITGKLFDKFGARWLSVLGLAIVAVTTYELTTLQTTTSYMFVLIVYTIRSFGIAIMMMPIMTAGLNDLPLALNRYGSAMLNTLRMIAGAVGMAFLVTIMSNSANSYVKDISTRQHILPTDKPHMLALANQGTVVGINDAFLVATGLAVLAFMLSFFIRRTPAREESDTTLVLDTEHPSAEPIVHVVKADTVEVARRPSELPTAPNRKRISDTEYREALSAFKHNAEFVKPLGDVEYREALRKFRDGAALSENPLPKVVVTDAAPRMNDENTTNESLVKNR